MRGHRGCPALALARTIVGNYSRSERAKKSSIEIKVTVELCMG